MDRPIIDPHLSITDLPVVLTQLFERAQQRLLPDTEEQPGLFVRYLRRKPGRGLAVIYTVDRPNTPHKARVNDPNRSVSLTLDEQALDGAQILFDAQQDLPGAASQPRKLWEAGHRVACHARWCVPSLVSG